MSVHGLLSASSADFEWADVVQYGSIHQHSFLRNITHSDSTFNILNHILNGTSVLNTIALNKGADVLRVHDIIEAKECLALFNKLN